ncbi:MAG: ABC transporter permease subunit [Alphaproteobacteria bacterium]|nr:ABC transporter permease subunit [Alphaproteobacteria bacterium]
MRHRRSAWLLSVVVFGYAFLHAPILLLIAYSFNESRLVTVWTGFSTHWYQALFANPQLLAAARLSLAIAAASAGGAVVLGTLGAVVLARLGSFRGRGLFAFANAAPLVMPEIITGLALLLLFVALDRTLGWPDGRGALTIALAHMTVATAYASVIVRSRLTALDPSLEEAALDLGATPLVAFFLVTVPAIWPALAAAWLLAFTLSLDDLVLASFTSGPGASTLPMVIYSSVRLGVSPQINALATILVVAVALVVGLAAWLLRRRMH